MDNNENENNKTYAFIQLVKCITDYYGSTKKMSNENNLKEIDDETKDYEDVLNDTANFFESLNNLGLEKLAINIPEDVDEEIRKTFLKQLKVYQEFIK